MDWTKTSFDDVADRSPKDLPMQWRFARGALGSPELGVSRFTYEAGARMPWGVVLVLSRDRQCLRTTRSSPPSRHRVTSM